MRANAEVTRREFLQAASVAGAGLVIGFHLPSRPRIGAAPPPSEPFAPNAWLRINPDDRVLILVDRSEMGPGVAPALPMPVAEALEAVWAKMVIVLARG